MAEYELVREIQNSCSGNQMRDVFFEEIETDDPVAYVRFASVYRDFREAEDFKDFVAKLETVAQSDRKNETRQEDE